MMHGGGENHYNSHNSSRGFMSVPTDRKISDNNMIKISKMCS